MRVLVDYRPALRARTGAGEYVHQLVSAYTASHPADDVAVFTSSWKDRPAPGTSVELGVRVIDRRVPGALLNFLWHRAGWPPIEWLAGRADVVHAAHPLLIPATHAAQVVTVHDLFFLASPDRTSAEIRRDYAALAGAHTRRADAVITPSPYTQRLVIDRLGVAPDRVHVCAPGAPQWTTLGQQPNVPADGYALFVGTLEPRKNVGVLLDAYARHAGGHGISLPRLVLAGGAGPGAETWLARLRRPPLQGVVSHVGYVDHGEREPLFRGARMLVLPSLDEGFGLPALEAMSAGIPVVVSDRGALPWVVGDAGVIADASDADAWAAALARLKDDQRWALNRAAAGLARARAFTWGAAAEALGGVYADALRRRRDPRAAGLSRADS